MMWKLVWRISGSLLILLALYASSCQSKPPVDTAGAPWYKALPDCPCKNPDGAGLRISDGWAIDKGDIAKYHPGAAVCYRSYPAVETMEGQSGQQCCYDATGKLITGGSAAGTPDKVSTCKGEDEKGEMIIDLLGVLGHYQKDVKPWEKLDGWEKYNELFPPNNNLNCRRNHITVAAIQSH